MTGRVLALLALIVSFAVPAAAQADVVATASGTNAGTRTATFQLTVPQGNDRYLAVGVSTTSANTVTAVTFGAQTLTRLQQATDNGVRSETWVLLSPNVGTAAVSLTTSGVEPVVLGATVFAGVDQTLPVIASSAANENSANNSASFTTNGTVAKDGMFATMTLTPVVGVSDIFMQGSVDLVVADLRWGTVQGTIRGAGASRIGNTGQNMALSAGMNFRWTKQTGALNPYALTWVALRASTGATQPVVTAPTSASITATTATLGGTLASTGGSTITRRGVVYCRCTDPVIGGNGVTTVDGTVNDTTGPFTVGASNLLASTQYTFKAFAANAIGTTYTAATNFTTAAPPNQVPTANAGGPYSVGEDGTITLNGSGTDADGDPLTYAWDLNNDGTYGDLTGAAPSLTRAVREQFGINDGFTGKTYPIRVRVSDGKDATPSAAVNLTVNDTVPDTTVGNSGPVPEGSTASVSFGVVTDPSSVDTGAGFRYAYDFDDNGTYEIGGSTYATATTSNAAIVPASFLSDGSSTRTVRMVVFDKDNGGHQYTTTITVNNVAPTATFASGVGASVPENDAAAAVFSNQQDPSAADAAALRYSYDWDNDGTWDTGDGTYAGAVNQASMTIPEQYRRDGPATLTVHGAILDKDGGRNEYRYTLTITNKVPTATAANRTVQEGQTASVGLTNPNDVPADLNSLRYVYDVDGNATDDTLGVSYANASTDTTRNVPAALTADGPATVLTRIRIIDKDGGSTPYTETVTVTNVKPTAALANSSVSEGSTASVGATGVADPGDLASLHYAYDLDGNATDDTAAVTYAAASTATTQNVPANLTADGPATVLVRVKVIDKDGESNVYTANVTVTNVAPSFTANATTPVDEGQIATASVAGVTDPSGADGAAGTRYAYDFDNDGTYDLGSTTYATASLLAQADLPAALTADGPGTRTVKIAVVDKDGGVTAHTVDVTVDNVAPTATLANVTAVEGTTATIAFTGADDVSAADKAAGFTFEWDADGDGTFDKGAGSIAVAAPDGPLTKTIKGAILDKDGGRREYTTTLTVTNAVPTASIAGPDAVPSSGATTLTLQLADVGADTVTSALNWGDGTIDTIEGTGEKTATHTYTTPGAKTITLIATDSDGADSAVATHTLTVAAAPASPPQTTPPAITPAAPKQTITGIKITPRCLRADDLRAKIAKAQTMKVRFSLGTAAPVKFTLQRLSGKGGASKCPPTRGVKHPDGKRVPGVYRPFTNKSVNVAKGANTVTVAATTGKGKRLAPGTYLLTVESGGVSARTKLWVLAN